MTQSNSERLYHQLMQNQSRRERPTDARFEKHLFETRNWQSQRLRHTHRHLLEHDRFGPAAEFFLSDLYGPQDFTQRDQDIERVYPIMTRILPDDILGSACLAMELNLLSHELDEELTRHLFHEMDVSEINAENYSEAFRQCDNKDLRQHQMDLIHETGAELDKYVHKKWIFNTLRMCRGPAHVAGFGALQSFLERGFAAFRGMDGAADFLDLILNTERQLLEEVYNGGTLEFSAP